MNAIIGLALITAFIAYDVYLALDGVSGNTWSEIARKFGMVSTVLPFAWAALAGHFWYPPGWRSPLQPTSGAVVLLWSVACVGMLGAVSRSLGWPVPPWLPLVPGFVAGWVLWPS